MIIKKIWYYYKLNQNVDQLKNQLKMKFQCQIHIQKINIFKKQLLQHHEITVLKAPSPNNQSSPHPIIAVNSPLVLPWSNIPSYSNPQSQNSPHVSDKFVMSPHNHNRNDTTIVHNTNPMHPSNNNNNNNAHFRIVSDSGHRGNIINKGPGNNNEYDDDDEKEGSITE
eukprot:24596_1